MGILSKIFDKVFHHNKPQESDASGSEESTTPSGAPAQPTDTPPTSAQPTDSQSASVSSMSQTDVEAVLNGMLAKQSQKLNWQTSIVDLMKLLDIDSSLQSRKELAQELNYTGDMNDSAVMNIWLHKQVMARFAANGGKVPASLLD